MKRYIKLGILTTDLLQSHPLNLDILCLLKPNLPQNPKYITHFTPPPKASIMPLDHSVLALPQSHFEPMIAFLTTSLQHIGFKEHKRFGANVIGMGESRPYFWLSGISPTTSSDVEGQEDEKTYSTVLKGMHIAFTATSTHLSHPPTYLPTHLLPSSLHNTSLTQATKTNRRRTSPPIPRPSAVSGRDLQRPPWTSAALSREILWGFCEGSVCGD